MWCTHYKTTKSSCNTKAKPYMKAIIFASVFSEELRGPRGCGEHAMSIFSVQHTGHSHNWHFISLPQSRILPPPNNKTNSIFAACSKEISPPIMRGMFAELSSVELAMYTYNA